MTRVKKSTMYFDGRAVDLDFERPPYMGEGLVHAFGRARDSAPPGESSPPYLYCGNGHCRDCNVMVEGLSDLPACRLPWIEGVEVRSGEGAGEPNALQRELGQASSSPEPAETIYCRVLVVGAGRTGSQVIRSLVDRGIDDIVWVDARKRNPRKELRSHAGVRFMAGAALLVHQGSPSIHRGRQRMPVVPENCVLAVGHRDRWPNIPGNGLAGVLPLELIERWIEFGLGQAEKDAFLISGNSKRARRLARRLETLGVGTIWREGAYRPVAAMGDGRLRRVRFQRATAPHGPDETVECDWLGVETEREPSTILAQALGCEIHFDRRPGHDRVRVDDHGATSCEGVYFVSSAPETERPSPAGLRPEGFAAGRRRPGDGASGEPNALDLSLAYRVARAVARRTAG